MKVSQNDALSQQDKSNNLKKVRENVDKHFIGGSDKFKLNNKILCSTP